MNTLWTERRDVKVSSLSDLKNISESKEARMNGGFEQPPFSLLKLPTLITHLLSQRGFSEDNIAEQWLYPKLSELKDPSLLKGLLKAVERILQAYRNNETICIYADFDLDGTSGLALLKTGMELIGFTNLISYQPKRLSEGYGFHASVVEDLKKLNVSLIITVDVGITAFAACEKAEELGIDVIITDHHLPAESLPVALEIVNPNQGTCPSELGYLCGAGVAFYLLRGIKRAFFESTDLPKNNWDLKEVLEYFTIGTLTDMVPLIGDNRVLVKHGLVKLSQTDKAGLKALLAELKLLDRPLTSQDVAIRFAPKLNALSRMESGILPIDIFLEKDFSKAQSMVSDILKNNSNRVSLQASAETEAMDLLKSWPHEDFVFVASENFHRGIVGLIATKVSQMMNKPAFVGSIGGDGSIVGSARLPQGQEICLVEALNSGKDSLNRFGGHSAAAGFELHQKHQNQLISSLLGFFSAQKERPKPLEIQYDLEVQLEEIDMSLMKWYDFVGPFGVGFPTPLFLIKDVIIDQPKLLKGGHYRLKLVSSDQGHSMEGMMFSPSARQVDFLKLNATSYQLLGELQWNYFAGKKSIQLLIRDLKPTMEK